MCPVISLSWKTGSPGTNLNVNLNFLPLRISIMIVAIFAVHLHVFPFTVAFRLYDRDGNGVLDSSVGGLSLKYNLLPIPHYVTKLNHHTQIISFGKIYNQSCFWKTGSGPHYCPDDARSRLPRLGCVRNEACELCFVCVCVCVCVCVSVCV